MKAINWIRFYFPRNAKERKFFQSRDVNIWSTHAKKLFCSSENWSEKQP